MDPQDSNATVDTSTRATGKNRGVTPPIDTNAITMPPDLVVSGKEAHPPLLGRYSLGEPLGEGGMGTVYRAEQLHPVRRPVALKLIKTGMDSARVVARFEVERQALALMDHPNIARVLDAGTTDQGRPYFAMELVEGAPINEFCDSQRLTIRQRLELFLLVCHGVQHAHQKGVMHRDLKPSNILVAMIDGHPVPKVIDFGLAKALERGAIPVESAETLSGGVLGTPLYMAPEQTTPGGDVDTRADIYALGVILYELLTGSTPLAETAKNQTSISEILRIVREGETLTPSARLRSATHQTVIAEARRTDPSRLLKDVRGDLEWITLKCLEKDRNRRYETANALAADVQRYLVDEPVLAGPPSRWDRVRKFIRRHRGPVLAASLVLLTLLGGIVGTTWALVRAISAEGLASLRLTEVQLAHEEIQRALDASEFERTRAQAAEKRATVVTNYLVDAFRRPNPKMDGRELKVVDLLDKAVTRLGNDQDMDPLGKAHLQDTLAQTYFGLGLADRAVPLLEKARASYEARHGVDHADTLAVMHRLMFTYSHAGRVAEAIALGEVVVERRKAFLGEDHGDTLLSMGQLAGCYWRGNRLEDALRLSEKALEGQRRQLGPEHEDLPNSIANLAMLYRSAGRTAAAIKLHEEAIALQKGKKGLEDPDTLVMISHLGRAYQDAGRTDEAITLQKETLEQLEQKLGNTHPRTVSAMINLANTYRSCGKIDAALPLNERSLELARKITPFAPGTVLEAMEGLAVTYSILRRSSESLAMLREIVATATKHYGARNPDTLKYLHNLGVALRQADQVTEAIAVLEQTLAGVKAVSHEEDRGLQTVTTQLASAYVAVNRSTDAIALLEPLLSLQKKKLDLNHRDLQVTMANLALAYESAGRLTEAIGLHQHVAERMEKTFGLIHPDTQTVIRYLGIAYRKANRLEEAEQTYLRLLIATRSSSPKDNLDLAFTLGGLGEVLLAAKKYENAEETLREAMILRSRITPDDWRYFQLQSLLGEALARLKKDAEAEPLLRLGYEGMRQRESKMSLQVRPRLTEAQTRLVEYYQRTGNTVGIEKYRP